MALSQYPIKGRQASPTHLTKRVRRLQSAKATKENLCPSGRFGGLGHGSAAHAGPWPFDFVAYEHAEDEVGFDGVVDLHLQQAHGGLPELGGVWFRPSLGSAGGAFGFGDQPIAWRKSLTRSERALSSSPRWDLADRR
jgi:hypothetical protein